MKNNLPAIIAASFILIGLLGVYWKPGGAAKVDAAYAQLYQQGLDAFHKREFVEAQSVFKKIASLDFYADSLQLFTDLTRDSILQGKTRLIKKGESLLHRQKYEQALQVFRALTHRYDNSAMYQDKVKEVERMMEENYLRILQEAEGLIADKKYAQARTKISEAQQLFPMDQKWQLLGSTIESEETDGQRDDLIKSIEKEIERNNLNKAKAQLEELKRIHANDPAIANLENKINTRLQTTFDSYVSKSDRCLQQFDCACARENLTKAGNLGLNSYLIDQKLSTLASKCQSKTCSSPSVKRPSKDDNIYISKVEISNRQTLVTLSFKKPSLSGTVYPPGHQEAFYLEQKKGQLISKLLEVRGLGSSNQLGKRFTTAVKSFTLVFGALPAGLEEFHLVEGSNNDETTTYWNFIGINISNCTIL